MVVWHIRELARRQGISSAQELARRTGLNKNTANMLWNEQTQRVDRSTLALLCRELKCTPGDMLTYLPALGGQSEDQDTRGNSMLTPLTA